MKSKRLKVILYALLVLAIVSGACSRQRTETDGALVTGIKAQLYSDAATKYANINVFVKDGVATLSGAVPNTAVEQQALHIAGAVNGVRRVDDQMKVDTSMAGIAGPGVSAPVEADNSVRPPLAASVPPASQSARTSAPPQGPPPASVPPVEPAPAQPVRAAPIEPVEILVPAGQHVSVRMIDSIDSARNSPGQVFRASLNSPLVSRGRVVVPAGAPVTVVLEDARGAGRIKGKSELIVALSGLQYEGRRYRLSSTTVEEVGKARGKSTAVRTGVGAAVGAIIGGLAGGGKGAAIGATVGGGGTAGYQLATHGQQVRIPSETVLNFRLEAPIAIVK